MSDAKKRSRPEDSDEPGRFQGAYNSSTLGDSSQRNENQSRVMSRLYGCFLHIPEEDKLAFSEARSRVPFIVDTESDPNRFLLCENFDSTKAAHRLLKYWVKRKDLFGEGAFLPMNQTGSGALSLHDVEVLSSGFIVLLKGIKPSRPFPFLFYDSGTLQGEWVEAQLRCFFYTITIAAEDEESQHGGIGFVMKLDITCLQQRIQAVQSCRDLIKDALPIRIRAVHVVYSSNAEKGRGGSVDLPTGIPQILRDIFPEGTSIYVHKDQNSLHTSLSVEGVSLNDLPSSLGGTMDSGKLRALREARIERETTMSERKLPPQNRKRPPSAESDLSVTSDSEHRPAEPPTVAQQPSYIMHPSLSRASVHPSEDESPGETDPQSKKKDIDFIRKRNALYSRRMYHKRKIELAVLEEQTANLESKKQALSQENVRLTRLLDDAKAVVALYESSADDSAREFLHLSPSSSRPLGAAEPSHHSSIPSTVANQLRPRSLTEDRIAGLPSNILRPTDLAFHRSIPWSQQLDLSLASRIGDDFQHIRAPNHPLLPVASIEDVARTTQNFPVGVAAARLRQQYLAQAQMNALSSSRLPSSVFASAVSQLGLLHPARTAQEADDSSSGDSSSDDSSSDASSRDEAASQIQGAGRPEDTKSGPRKDPPSAGDS